MSAKWDLCVQQFYEDYIESKSHRCEDGRMLRTDSLKKILRTANLLDQREWEESNELIRMFMVAVDWNDYLRDDELYSITTSINNRLGIQDKIKIINMDELLAMLHDNSERLLIFGAGIMGMKLFQVCVSNKLHAEIVVGESYSYQMNNYCLPISMLESIDFDTSDGILILAAKSNYHMAMLNDLADRWQGQIVTLTNSEFDRMIQGTPKFAPLNYSYESILDKRTPPEKLTFILDIVEHCNLNCQCCNHFSPLSDDYYMSFEEFAKDIRRVHELVGEKIALVKLEGGEPLLHPEVTSFIIELRKVISNCRIELVTNGILLENMDEEFWRACADCNVCIRPTRYPINLDYYAMKTSIEKRGIEVNFFNGEKVQKTTFYEPLDINGSQDKYESFHFCRKSNRGCADLKHGKLYSCTFTANLHIFNKRFPECQFMLDKRDYIDIYSDITSEDIFDFLCNPTPACKYCKVKEWVGGFAWAISKRKKEEWISE